MLNPEYALPSVLGAHGEGVRFRQLPLRSQDEGQI